MKINPRLDMKRIEMTYKFPRSFILRFHIGLLIIRFGAWIIGLSVSKETSKEGKYYTALEIIANSDDRPAFYLRELAAFTIRGDK